MPRLEGTGTPIVRSQRAGCSGGQRWGGAGISAEPSNRIDSMENQKPGHGPDLPPLLPLAILPRRATNPLQRAALVCEFLRRMLNMPKRRAKGVYCIEGDWWAKPHRQSSVRPMLELLSKWDGCPVPFVHRDVATRAEFDHYIAQATQRQFQQFSIIYFGLHGSRGTLFVGDRRAAKNEVDVQDIAEALSGRCAGKVLYFASCETLDVHGNELNGILRRTGAKAVCGYRASVDWLESTAFDTLFLGELQHNAMTKSGLSAVTRRLQKKAKTLIDRLKFHMVVG